MVIALFKRPSHPEAPHAPYLIVAIVSAHIFTVGRQATT
jgi:hypothetical protein